MIVYLVLSLAIILAVNFIVFQTLGNGILSCILKLFASIAFIALGIAGIAFGDGTTNIGLLFILGAGFGLVGDGVLALREMDDGSKDFLIILNGIVSFAVGHIFYYVALVQYAGFTFWAPVIGTILTCAIILVSIFAMKLNYHKLLIPVVMYAFMLTTTMVQAIFGAIVMGGSVFSILAAIGFTLFLASDLVLSLIYFVPNKDKRLVITNYSLYYPAQILIMLALFFI